MKPQAILPALIGVYEFYGKSLSDFAIGIWVDALKPFELTAVEAAFRAHMGDPAACQFLPKPGDIIGRLTVRSADHAQVEWAAVLTAARCAGSVALSMPGRLALDAIGGMYAVRMCQETEVGWLCRRFVEAHQSAGRREAVASITMQPQERLQ
jgi:hypothetical protein